MHIPINHLRKLFAKWLSLLLQIGGPLIITKRVRFITNQDSYYHLMQIFYKSRQLLQIVHNYFNVKKDTTCIVDLLRNLAKRINIIICCRVIVNITKLIQRFLTVHLYENTLIESKWIEFWTRLIRKIEK